MTLYHLIEKLEKLINNSTSISKIKNIIDYIFLKNEGSSINEFDIIDKKGYLEANINFNVDKSDRVSVELFPIIENILSNNELKFSEERKKFSEDYCIILISIITFRSKEGWRASNIALDNKRISFIDDKPGIIEFCERTQEVLIEKIERYSIEEIDSLVIKVV